MVRHAGTASRTGGSRRWFYQRLCGVWYLAHEPGGFGSRSCRLKSRCDRGAYSGGERREILWLIRCEIRLGLERLPRLLIPALAGLLFRGCRLVVRCPFHHVVRHAALDEDGNECRLAALAVNGIYLWETLLVAAKATPVAMTASAVGIALFRRQTDTVFRRLLITLLFASGLLILVRELRVMTVSL